MEMSASDKEKLAGVLSSLGSAAWNGAKGLYGFGASAGASRGARLLNGAGQAYNIAAPVAQAMNAGQNAPKIGSELGNTLLKIAFFSVSHMTPGDVADALSYGTFLGAKFVDPEKHPLLHTGLDAAGLLGLGATTAHSLITKPEDRGPSAKDLTGLALMGSALYDRYKQHMAHGDHSAGH